MTFSFFFSSSSHTVYEQAELAHMNQIENTHRQRAGGCFAAMACNFCAVTAVSAPPKGPMLSMKMNLFLSGLEHNLCIVCQTMLCCRYQHF
jgi:hypothetical protein